MAGPSQDSHRPLWCQLHGLRLVPEASATAIGPCFKPTRFLTLRSRLLFGRSPCSYHYNAKGMTAQGLVVADAFRQVLNGAWPYAPRNPAPGGNGAI